MSDIDFEQTYLVTFRAGKELATVSTIRSITLAATTTDEEDARFLAYSDLVEEFGPDVARHFEFVNVVEESSRG